MSSAVPGERQPSSRFGRLAVRATPVAVTSGFFALGSGVGAAVFLGLLGTIAVGGFRAVVSQSLL